jgi:hypothetical protein
LNLRGEVMRVPIGGGAAERLAQTAAMPLWLVIDDLFAYFSTSVGDVWRVPKAGGVPSLVAPASSPRREVRPVDSIVPNPYPVELTLAGGKIYWADGSGIFACPIAGCAGAPEIVVEPGNNGPRPYSFAIAGTGAKLAAAEKLTLTDSYNGLYDWSFSASWSTSVSRDFNFYDGQTAYYELRGDSRGVYALATTWGGVVGVAYFPSPGPGEGGRAGGMTFLANGKDVPSDPRGLAVDDDYVYWASGPFTGTDYSQGIESVARCKKTGCATPEVLGSGQIVPRAVAVNKDAVFWTTGNGRVMKVAKPPSSPMPAR